MHTLHCIARTLPRCKKKLENRHRFSNFFLQLFSIKNKKVRKTVQNVHCAVQNVHCAHPNCKKYSIRMFIKSKFTPAHQITAFYLEKQKSLKTGAKCALYSAKCALCSRIRSDLIARFKRPRKKKHLLRVSEKSVEN